MTLTGSELAEVVEQACNEARAKAREADGLLRQRNEAVNNFNQCAGALGVYGPMDAQRMDLVRELALAERERDSLVSRLWVVIGVVGGLVAGGLIGWGVGKLL